MTIRPSMANLVPVFALALVFFAGPGAAQTMYKCISAGKTSYGQTPCSSGTTLKLEPPPAPAPPRTPATPRRIDALRLQADQLTRERHRREADDARIEQRAASAAAKRRDNCERLRLHKKWADEDAAHARHQGKAALTARRAAEKLALACPH